MFFAHDQNLMKRVNVANYCAHTDLVWKRAYCLRIRWHLSTSGVKYLGSQISWVHLQICVLASISMTGAMCFNWISLARTASTLSPLSKFNLMSLEQSHLLLSSCSGTVSR